MTGVSTNSVIKNITVVNSEMGFLLFTGFMNVSLKNMDVIYYFDITQLNYTNNFFENEAAIIKIGPYVDKNPA
jgi:hypothetical protein